MIDDDEAAALYDLLNPWDPGRWPADAFYSGLVMSAGSVLDVGCGTGAMLHHARESGHTGRLVGVDPDRAAVARARRRTDVEWVDGIAPDGGWRAEFDLATMVSHAFQCLVTDEQLRDSLTAIRTALRAGGGFAFETRHPQARAWEQWNPSNAMDVTDGSGRLLRSWNEVESVSGDLVTFTDTVTGPDGTVLRVDRTTLRFLDIPTLDALLTDAGFTVEARYGDWHRGPVDDTSREIVTIARRS